MGKGCLIPRQHQRRTVTAASLALGHWEEGNQDAVPWVLPCAVWQTQHPLPLLKGSSSPQSLSGKAQNSSASEGSQRKAQRVGLGPAAGPEFVYVPAGVWEIFTL